MSCLPLTPPGLSINLSKAWTKNEELPPRQTHSSHPRPRGHSDSLFSSPDCPGDHTVLLTTAEAFLWTRAPEAKGGDGRGDRCLACLTSCPLPGRAPQQAPVCIDSPSCLSPLDPVQQEEVPGQGGCGARLAGFFFDLRVSNLLAQVPQSRPSFPGSERLQWSTHMLLPSAALPAPGALGWTLAWDRP